MAGIFPTGGVIHTSAINTVNVPTVAGCAELFHSTTRCQPKFDPAAANAIISEMLNFMNSVGHVYDCNNLTNLTAAMGRFTAGGGGSCNCPPSSGAGVPTASPSPIGAPYYVDTSASPQTLYYWNGTVWNQLGAAQGLTTLQVNQLIAAQIAAIPNTDTDISAVSMAISYPILAPTGNSPINISTTVTEDITVLTGQTNIPYWSVGASGVVQKASGPIADQDFDLGLGNLESIAAPVGVGGATGLDAQRGMVPRTTYGFITNNFFIMSDRTFLVGVDARWPTLASVYEYLAHRVISTEAFVTIQLPPGVIDLTTTGLGPAHPQPKQITVLGTAGTVPPTENQLVCTGFSAAARSADAAANRALLLAAFPTILLLQQGITTAWTNGDYGHGSVRDVTFRTGADGNLAINHSQTNRNALFFEVFIDGGNLSITNSWLGVRNLYSIGNPAQIAALRLVSDAKLQTSDLIYLAGSAECGLHASGGSSIAALPTSVLSVLRVEGCEIHNICLHSKSTLNTYGMRVEAHHAGEDNIELSNDSLMHLADDDGGSTTVTCTNPNGSGYGAGNILVENGSTLSIDNQANQVRLILDGGQYGVKATVGTTVNIPTASVTNHANSHFIFSGAADAELHDPLNAGGITSDASPAYSIYAESGARVNTNAMAFAKPTVPVRGTPDLTTLTVIS